MLGKMWCFTLQSMGRTNHIRNTECSNTLEINCNLLCVLGSVTIEQVSLVRSVWRGVVGGGADWRHWTMNTTVQQCHTNLPHLHTN